MINYQLNIPRLAPWGGGLEKLRCVGWGFRSGVGGIASWSPWPPSSFHPLVPWDVLPDFAQPCLPSNSSNTSRGEEDLMGGWKWVYSAVKPVLRALELNQQEHVLRR